MSFWFKASQFPNKNTNLDEFIRASVHQNRHITKRSWQASWAPAIKEPLCYKMRAVFKKAALKLFNRKQCQHNLVLCTDSVNIICKAAKVGVLYSLFILTH